MNLKEFIKRNTLLCLHPKRNALGDLVIGYNRPARSHSEQVSIEKANLWLDQDIQKALKEASKNQLGDNEICVFLLFYVNRRRWPKLKELFKLIKEDQLVKAALFLTNANWFSKDFSLGANLATKIAQGVTEL